MFRPGSLVAGVVLAAGRSRRFAADRSKLLAELGGEPIVRRVIRAALGSRLGQVLVVVGHAAAEVRRALGELDVEWVDNPCYAEGQSTSVRAALERVAPAMRWVLFLPGDQPLTSSHLIDRLIDATETSARPIIRPTAHGRPGAPVVWERSLFEELAAMSGDAGGRQLIAGHTDQLLEVEIDDPLALADVDTVEDLRKLRQALRRRQV